MTRRTSVTDQHQLLVKCLFQSIDPNKMVDPIQRPLIVNDLRGRVSFWRNMRPVKWYSAPLAIHALRIFFFFVRTWLPGGGMMTSGSESNMRVIIHFHLVYWEQPPACRYRVLEVHSHEHQVVGRPVDPHCQVHDRQNRHG